MGQLRVIHWRDIPAQLTAKAGRATAKRELSARFMAAIDRAAMISGAHEADAYLAEWRRGEATECGDDLEAAVEAAADEIERRYDEARLGQLAKAGGREN